MEFKAAGNSIRTARSRKQWSQKELATAAAIDVTYVSKIERGTLEYVPKTAVLERLAIHLELDLRTLKHLYGLPTAEWLPSTVYLPDYVG